jgi:hypothetical protein
LVGPGQLPSGTTLDIPATGFPYSRYECEKKNAVTHQIIGELSPLSGLSADPGESRYEIAIKQTQRVALSGEEWAGISGSALKQALDALRATLAEASGFDPSTLGTVSGAADHLALSQSATSHSLSRLREACRDDLFVRTRQGLSPTPVAKEMYPAINGHKNCQQVEVKAAHRSGDPRRRARAGQCHRY